MRLIDADAFKKYIEDGYTNTLPTLKTDKYRHLAEEMTKAFLKDIDEQPTVNQQLIHCKDCKHYEGNWHCSAWNNSPGFPMVTEDGFCDLAERREDDENRCSSKSETVSVSNTRRKKNESHC